MPLIKTDPMNIGFGWSDLITGIASAIYRRGMIKESNILLRSL